MTLFFASLFGLLALVAAAYWRWARRIEMEIKDGGDVVWRSMQEREPAFLAGIERGRFDAIYRRVHFPRGPKYALATIAAFVLALPVVFAALSVSVWIGQRVGVLAEPAAVANYIPIGEPRSAADAENRAERALYIAQGFAGFYYYFGLFAAWLAIVAAATRLYHSRRPGHLRDEIIRARDAAPSAGEKD